MQIQTASSVLFNTRWTGEEQFQFDPDLISIYLVQQFQLITTILKVVSVRMVKMNFSTQVSSPPTWSGRTDISQKYTCRNSIHISQCPRFHETCKGKGGVEMRKEKGTEQTPGIIFLIPLFSSPLSQEGFCRSELLIHSLHSICMACHFYQIMCGISHSSGPLF